MDKRITFKISSDIAKKLDAIKDADKRSIQKEIEWLIERRHEEVKK